MRPIRELSLKKRLVMSFAGVVILAALISTIVFTVVLVSTMKKSARDKVEETSRVALTHIDDLARGLQIYADLIASDINFGQTLSFDSSSGIFQKISEFAKLSSADVVAFVPRPEQYVEIKDLVFVNEGNEALGPPLKAEPLVRKLLEPVDAEAQKGWLPIGEDLYLYSMKPVLHFGTNMGVIFLAKKCQDSFSKTVATAAGTDIVIFNDGKVFGTTLPLGAGPSRALPQQKVLFTAPGNSHLEENYEITKRLYLAFFVPLKTADGKKVATLSLQVSGEAIQKARNETLQKVLIVAILATLLSALIGYYLARAISNPLQTITKGIHAIIEKGDLGIRMPGSFGAEIGILSESFNRLLGQLQDAHEKLAASERRMKQELTMASTVQEMLFPDRLIRYQGLELASFIDTSTETGGDWFGYGQDRSGGRVTVLIGDVTGHGMPAALITAITNGFFTGVQEAEDAVRQVLAETGGPARSGEALLQPLLEQLRQSQHLGTGDMLAILNQIILRSTKGSLLMTFFASAYDGQRKELRYANAGHNRPFICTFPNGGQPKVTVLPSDPSHRLGESADVKFTEQSIPLSAGDLLFWYTDGILECENPAGEMYGKRRFMNAVKDCATLPSEQIRDRIIQDAYRFFGDTPRKDDITLVVGKVL